MTSIKGSTIRARRVKDGKVKCRDASKVKPLRTAQLSEVNDETGSVKVPSGYNSTTSMMRPEDTDGRNKRDAINEAENTTSETDDTMSGSWLRRSERIKTSSYQGKYKLRLH